MVKGLGLEDSNNRGVEEEHGAMACIEGEIIFWSVITEGKM